MSIRMQEWGMMRAPANNVHVPVQGLMGWDSAVRSLGEGVSAVLESSAELVLGEERVQQTGELARFSQRLHEIDAETRAELAERDVQDWDYAWQAACEPRLAAAVEELPPAARQAGAELARAYSQRASLEARRDHKVRAIQRARSQWQSRVDNAVDQGDEQEAQRWVETGRDVFVAAAHEEDLSRQVRSRARLARWEQDFADNPLQTLQNWHNASDDDLPGGEDERRRLGDLARTYLQEGRETLLAQAGGCFRDKKDLPASTWEQARQAGLISPAQFQNSTAPHRSLGEVERCLWLRKVDEAEDAADARLALSMDIATTPMPLEERAGLLQRLDANAGVPRMERLTLSRNLWNLYNAGAFGCPGDAMAGRHLADLQRDGAGLLASRGAEATAAWLKSQDTRTGRWVCFSDLHPTNA